MRWRYRHYAGEHGYLGAAKQNSASQMLARGLVLYGSANGAGGSICVAACRFGAGIISF